MVRPFISPNRSLAAAAFLALASLSASVHASTIYMSSGNTVYQFDGVTGLLLHSGQVDTTNVQAEGLAIGPDGKLYAAVAYGENRVVSFNSDLTGRSTYVSEGQGGLFTPGGIDFAPGASGSLFVASTNQQTVDRFQGPNGASPGASEPSSGKSGAIFASSVGNPLGLAIAGDGAIYITRENNNGEIDYINAAGISTPVVTNLGSNVVGDIAINGTQMFVRDANKILQYTVNPDHTLTSDPSFQLVFTEGTSLDSSVGLTFGEGGFLYADERSINSSPGLNSTNNTDWIVRIDPATGTVSRYVFAGINTFLSSGDPTFLTSDIVAVPEPSFALLGTIVLTGLAMRRRRVA